jgi:signal transduction histidine kinase
MNAIIGFAEMLLVGIYGELPQEAHKMIHGIYTRGENMVGLINNLLDMTQIEAGQFDVILSEVDDVDMMIYQTIVTLETQVGDRPLEIIADLPDELPSVYADRRRLQQIFLNLGTNAVKFTDEGSVEIKASVEGTDMRFSVIDTGMGIPPDKQKVIFDKFKRVDMSETRKRGGLGLGLAICKELIQMHKGEIGLKSQEGVGSEFYFTIPLAKN